MKGVFTTVGLAVCVLFALMRFGLISEEKLPFYFKNANQIVNWAFGKGESLKPVPSESPNSDLTNIACQDTNSCDLR